MGKPGLGSWKASPGSQGGRTRNPVWAPPLSSLTHSCACIYSIPQEHLKPPQEDAPHQHPALPVVRGLTVFAVCPLCFLPIPITCCSHVCSPLNYDKRVLSFISVSKPVSCQPTHHKVARDILLPMRSDHLFPIVSREAAQGLVDGRLNGCRMSE